MIEDLDDVAVLHSLDAADVAVLLQEREKVRDVEPYDLVRRGDGDLLRKHRGVLLDRLTPDAPLAGSELFSAGIVPTHDLRCACHGHERL